MDFITNEYSFVSRYIFAMRIILCCVAAVLTIAIAQTRKVSDAEVQKVHKSALLIDTHNDITSRTVEGYDIGKAKDDGHTNLTALREGGVGAQFFAVYVAASYVNGNHSARRTLEMIDTVRHDIIERYPNDFVLATTADDIERIHKQGKIAALMGIEGGHAHRGQPAAAARLLRAGHPLHDADAHQHQQLGRFIGRHRQGRRRASQRAHRFRQSRWCAR